MRHNYENLEVYNRSLSLAVDVVKMTDELRPYRLAEQIAGSAISIPSNIAEGSERGSDKEFKRFLEYASGSASELITQLKITHLTNKAVKFPIEEFINECKEINAMVRGLMNKLKA